MHTRNMGTTGSGGGASARLPSNAESILRRQFETAANNYRTAMNKPIDANVDPMALGKDSRCHKLRAADLSALINEAAMAALVDKQSSSDTSSSVPCTIKDVHFATAFKKVSPSVSDEQIQQYKLLAESFRAEG